MFRLLGTTVARYGVILLALWGLALGLGWWLAPAWQAVTRTAEISSLPASAPSVRADQLYQEAFPLEFSHSNVVLVFSRENGELGEVDDKFIDDEVARGLREIQAEENSPISTIRTPADKKMGALLVSEDRRAYLVLVELNTALQEYRNVEVINKIAALIDRLRVEHKFPAGLDVAMTGSATAGADLDRAEAASVRVIEVWTIIMVIVLLLLLYRAPFVTIIPLATVAVSVAVSLAVLSSLTAAGILSPSRDLRVFITVLAYGAGVDYCLFLIARYREELGEGRAPAEAIAHSVTQVGGAITASAATVICGIGMLAFGEFAKIRQAGLVIPLALGVVLVGTLTFGAALLRLAGRWAFWPLRIAADGGQGRNARWLVRILGGDSHFNVWEKIAAILMHRPGAVWLGTVLVMMPFVVAAAWFYGDTNFNPLSDLPKDATSVVGTRALGKHFPVGVLGSVIVLVEKEGVDFTSDSGVDLVRRLSDRLIERKHELELADVRSIALPLGTSSAAKERLAAIRGKKESIEEVIREEAQSYYVCQADALAGHLTRLELTLATDPLTRQGIATLDRLQEAILSFLPAGLRGARIELAGPTASLRDISDVKRRDEELIQVLVPAVVFILLLILLRRVIVSLYLVASVLFSYFATLGLTYLVFRELSADDFVGLDWKVPIFLFTILVAVGEDYNIFLLTRVMEEQKRHGTLGAIPVAMARTGRVISGCGFIMAGTFASLLSGSLRAMKELGFALAVGVLVDTLIVRPILVPAFLVLLQRLFPGPLGRFMALGPREVTGTPENQSVKVGSH